MLVAQARENNVVSFGGEAEDFGVADIGVILEMLSTTLYTDKPRAVSREVLCNAFDAHFAAGREDLPVDVVIDDKQIEFRDYGYGIARDQIGPVYCTFAASTKANDETQTGGHGVGAKSPFSVTDQFTIISRHAGTLSTFSLFTTDRVPQHRYVGGRPCEDEGISVIIPLKNANLGASMRHHILRVAEDAGMKIRINGELFDFTSAMLFENADIRITTRKGHRDAVDILYGRVIYPFQHDVDPELDALHREVGKIAEKLRGRHSSVTISIKAPPSSLATALSRESLSYTPMSYLKRLITMKRETLPSAYEARLWSNFRLGGGPMSSADYHRHVSFSDKESAERLLRLRARTATGWFAASCYRWLTFWNVTEYELNRDDIAWD